MSTRSLIKVAALVGGIAWAIYLAIQWNDYFTGMSALEKNPFSKLALAMASDAIASLRTRLILQTIGALMLIGLGIVIKDDQENSNLDPVKSLNFYGTTDLTNDAYKIFLVERYAINKNDVLGGYTLNGTIHKSLDEALNAAHLLYSPPASSSFSEAIKTESKPQVASSTKDEPLNSEADKVENQQRTMETSNFRYVAVVVLLLLTAAGGYFFNQKKSDPISNLVTDFPEGWHSLTLNEYKGTISFDYRKQDLESHGIEVKGDIDGDSRADKVRVLQKNDRSECAVVATFNKKEGTSHVFIYKAKGMCRENDGLFVTSQDQDPNIKAFQFNWGDYDKGYSTLYYENGKFVSITKSD